MSYNAATAYKGKGPTNLYKLPQWPVTTTAPTLPFTKGQKALKSLLEPVESWVITDPAVQPKDAEAKPQETVITIKMFDLDYFPVGLEKMTTPPTRCKDSILIEQEKHDLRQLPQLIGREKTTQSSQGSVINVSKSKDFIAIELQFNQLFAEVATVTYSIKRWIPLTSRILPSSSLWDPSFWKESILL